MKFLREISKLMTGSALGQLIILLAAPIITRLYTPEEFGVLAVYLSIVGILSAVVTLRYELAIPLPNLDKVAVYVFYLCTLITIIIGVIVILIIFFNHKHIYFEGLGVLVWLIPLGVLLSGVYQALFFWATRKRDFFNIAKTRVLMSFGQVAVQLAAAFTVFKTAGLLFSIILGQILGVYLLFKSFNNKNNYINKKKILSVAKRYKDFPKFSVWAAGVLAIAQHAPPIIIAYYYTSAEAGIFLLARRVAFTPASMLGSAVSQVNFRDLVVSKKNNVLAENILPKIRIMQWLVLIPSTLLMIIVPTIVETVFGREWKDIGVYVQWMLPWLAISIIFSPIGQIIPVMGWQKLGLAYQIVSACLSLLLLIFIAHSWGVLYSIAAYSLSRAFLILVYRLYLLSRVNISVIRILAPFFVQLPFIALIIFKWQI